MAEDPKIHSRKVKVKAVGRLEMLPDNVRNAIKNVEEHISYQQKKVSDYSVEELRKLILSEEKKILHGAGWKGAIVAVGAMFGITNF